MTNLISRRGVSRGLGVALLLGDELGRSPAAASGRMTAEQIVDRIKSKCAEEGIAWGWPGIDTFKYGDPRTPVTGVAATFQATFDVLKRAVATKKNFVISHERMFWDFIDDDVRTLRQDAAFDVAGSLESDPVFVAKRQFCEANGLVVWRFHDHWHRGWMIGRPDPNVDPILGELTKNLGWEKYLVRMEGGSSRCGYEIPPTRLKDVARHVRQRLGTRDVRVIGDPDLMVRRIGNGGHQLKENLDRLQDADVVMVGETEEFDMFHYVRDAISLGAPRPRGLIVFSHDRLEEWGMEVLPAWLRPLMPGIPVEYLSSGNPYWVLPQAV